MLTGPYQDLLPAIADCAAALTGLLFVAMTVARRHSPPDRPVVIEQVRAAACILAFTNALAVSLFGLVPGNNAGYPAAVLAVTGIFFTAAGTRSIFSGPLPWRHVPQQLGLIALLLLTFAFELAAGIVLILNPHSTGAAGLISNLLVALLIIGIARAWELVGDRHAGIIASIAVLTGHDPNHDGSLPAPASPDPATTTGPGHPGPPTLTSQTSARSELHSAGERNQLATVVNDGETHRQGRRFPSCPWPEVPAGSPAPTTPRRSPATPGSYAQVNDSPRGHGPRMPPNGPLRPAAATSSARRARPQGASPAGSSTQRPRQR